MAIKGYSAFASASDCLVSYTGHSLGEGVLPLSRGAVGVFYSPRQPGNVGDELSKHRLHYFILSSPKGHLSLGPETVRPTVLTLRPSDETVYFHFLLIFLLTTTCIITKNSQGLRYLGNFSAMRHHSVLSWRNVNLFDILPHHRSKNNLSIAYPATHAPI